MWGSTSYYKLVGCSWGNVRFRDSEICWQSVTLLKKLLY
jgi:hypothetical protein